MQGFSFNFWSFTNAMLQTESISNNSQYNSCTVEHISNNTSMAFTFMQVSEVDEKLLNVPYYFLIKCEKLRILKVTEK